MKLDLETLHRYCHEGEGPCMMWAQGLNNAGYPQARIDNRPAMVRREVFRLANGRYPNPGFVVVSRCEEKTCVSPACLGEKKLATILRKSWRDGNRRTSQTLRGAALRGRKVTAEQVLAIRSRAHEPRDALAAEFGISKSHVHKICRGINWRCLLGRSVFDAAPLITREAA